MKTIIYWLNVILGFYDTEEKRNYCKFSKDYVDYKKVDNYDK